MGKGQIQPWLTAGSDRGIKMIKWMSITFTAFMLAFGLPACTTVQEKPVYVAKEPGPPPWAPAHGYRTKHHYYYYPGPGVYYDVDRKIYFYPQGSEWRVSASLPVGIRLDVHSYTVLDMDADKPYVYHGEVAKRYPPGQLKKAEGKGNKGKGNKGD
jgi:hypothetical protein